MEGDADTANKKEVVRYDRLRGKERGVEYLEGLEE